MRFNIYDYPKTSQLIRPKDMATANREFGRLTEFLTRNRCADMAIGIFETVLSHATVPETAYVQICELLDAIRQEIRDNQVYRFKIEENQIEVECSPLMKSFASQLYLALDVFEHCCDVETTDQLVFAFFTFLNELKAGPMRENKNMRNIKEHIVCSIIIAVSMMFIIIFGIVQYLICDYFL